MEWLVALLIQVAVQAIIYVMTPKPKGSGSSVREAEGPTAEDGKVASVIFGEVLVQSPNCLHTSDKSSRVFKIDA